MYNKREESFHLFIPKSETNSFIACRYIEYFNISDIYGYQIEKYSLANTIVLKPHPISVIYQSLRVCGLLFTICLLHSGLQFVLKFSKTSPVQIKSRNFKESSYIILYFKEFFGRYQHFAEQYYVTCVQITDDGIDKHMFVQTRLLFHYCVQLLCYESYTYVMYKECSRL